MSILIVHRPKIVYVVYTERAKNVDFLRVDNFETVSGTRKAYDMSNVFTFCLERRTKLACR